jgi:hypothetical protein
MRVRKIGNRRSVIGPNWLDAKDDDGRRRFDKF